MNIRIVEKDETVSWDSLAKLIRISHSVNERFNLSMKTAMLTAEMMEEKVCGGKTFIALDENNRLVGTASVVLRKGSGKWYDKGKTVAFNLYLAVHPDFQGNGIASKLYIYRENLAKDEWGVDVIKSGTAQKNVAQRKNFKKNGYIPVELTSNRNVDYYSVIYMKYLDGKLPYPRWICTLLYCKSIVYFRCRYKPGKIDRCAFTHYFFRLLEKINLV